MHKILITGCAGFIGFHLTSVLLARDCFVYGIDNMVTGRQENIDELTKKPNFKFIKQDVVEEAGFFEKVDFLFHFASPASPDDFDKLSLEIALANSVGTLNMLKLAAKNQAYFILASTSEIYGDPLEHPQKESYFGNVNPLGPRSVYDESKRFGETLTADFMRKSKIQGNILRIFNTYGPRMRADDGRVVSNLITQVLKNKPLTLYGDGRQTRSLCYIDDLVEVILEIGLSRKNPGETYNIGNDEEIEIRLLAEKIKDLTSSSSQIKFLAKRPDDPIKRRPDLSKVKRDFGWQAKVGLEEGLGKTIEYFKQSLEY